MSADNCVLMLYAGGFEMFKLKKSLHILPVLAMVIVLAFGSVPVPAGAADGDAEPTATLEIVSSYPYTTKTKVKVNLRASRSVRSELLYHIPAGAEITVNSVSQKSGWADVTYGKYNGYVKSEYIVLKEVKKITRKLTVKLIVTGVALAGVVLLVNNSDKIVGLITKPKD